MSEVRWERMFPDQLESAFETCPLVWYTYGLCEPHGPHNAVGLDALKAHGIACYAAREHGGIVAPPDYWHIHEMGGYALWSERAVGQPPHSWLTCMPPWQHFKNICYHLRQADTLGFHAAILITGHYGPNWQDLKTLCELVQPHIGTRIYSLPDHEANKPGFDSDNKSSGDHAGKVETSLLWALSPECVDVSRFPPEDEPGPHFAMGATARLSDRQIGERMVADEVRWLGDKAKELLEAYDREKPEHKLLTFEDVETLWETVIRPEFKDFQTMQSTWKGDVELPETSMWYRNWEIPDRD
ncbi:MAG: creatininase family protein [bacterium]|nr:creatininase family protein [bacterium]